MSETDLDHLRTSIDLAWKARERGNHPFGAVLANAEGLRLLIAENTVSTERDVTGHAELNLVRLATRDLSAEQLARCTLYASTEPCAMCAGAAFWAGIGRVVYALSEADLYALIGHSAGQLVIPCRKVFARAGRRTLVEGPCDELRDEAHAVHTGFWKRRA
ncbi:MAG: nucleoside deaminase [Burkholderiaceae bacterium]